mmetsp:Transcript_2992/g.7104  ORF Transcript_2992/g.7104 Transcript_2992/m.7104 type:complete len:544 (-) Transcript_2992:149-1780(-)
MTEFKRTLQAVEDIERLVQTVLDGGSAEDVQRLSQLVGETGPVVEKLRAKASEADPNKRTYGPQMCEKVLSLAGRWDSIQSLARDVLQQRGTTVAAPPPAALPPPPPAPPSLGSTVWRPPASEAVPREPAPRLPPASAASQADGLSRRELAARAAEARFGRGSDSRAQGSSAAPSSSPGPMEVDAGAARERSTPSGAIGASTVAPAQTIPVVARMEALMHLVHCVFLGHGFSRAEGEGSSGEAWKGPGTACVRYVHKDRPTITTTYVPVQRHLIVYACSEGVQDNPSRATVQLGMAAQSVQAKVDYLLVYPLIYRQCVPTLPTLPPEVCFSVLASVSLPALAALGATSRSLKAAAFEDDTLWWQVLLALPRSDRLRAALDATLGERPRGEALPAAASRRLVREEVERLRADTEERRRREEEAERLRRELRDPLQMGPPRRPRPFPGGFGGNMIGGPDDIMPGGGIFPPGPFGGGGGGMGGRRPFGGGGGGFGGGGFGGGGFGGGRGAGGRPGSGRNSASNRGPSADRDRPFIQMAGRGGPAPE